MISSLTSAISGSAANPLIKGAAGNITSQFTGDIPFSDATGPDAASAAGNNPKAYLTILFFDERFNFVEEGSISLRVTTAGNGADPLVLENIKAPKNGYAYIYVSNEADEHVYFDNLQSLSRLCGISHTRGRIIEENHYYAYGLRIAGISSKKLGDIAEGSLKNDYLWQGDYSEFDEDIGWNDFALRSYDPQVGRWVQMDPYDEFPSPYTGIGNDPINNVDPSGGFLGLSPLASVGVSTLGGAIVGTAVDILNGGDGTTGAAIGAGVGLLAGVAGTYGIRAIAGATSNTVSMAARGVAQSQNDLYLNSNSNSNAIRTNYEVSSASGINDDGFWKRLVKGYKKLDRRVGEHGGDWINENINPLTPVVEFISGKAYIEGHLIQDKSRIQSLTEAGLFFIPQSKLLKLGFGTKILNIAVPKGFKEVKKFGLWEAPQIFFYLYCQDVMWYKIKQNLNYLVAILF